MNLQMEVSLNLLSMDSRVLQQYLEVPLENNPSTMHMTTHLQELSRLQFMNTAYMCYPDHDDKVFD